jgi:signal transduction histidine kinase
VSVLAGLFGASSRQPSSTRRVVAWVVAIAGPPLIGLASMPFRSSFGLAGGLFLMILVVVGVAVTGGLRPALATVVAGELTGAFFLAPPYDNLGVKRLGDGLALVMFALVGTAVGVLVNELARLGEEQEGSRRVETALRRVATLVAEGPPADELFMAVTAEVGQLLPVDFAIMGRYEADETIRCLATWGSPVDRFPVGSRSSLAGRNLVTIVHETGLPARVDGFEHASGRVGVAGRESGFRSTVGTPIVVEGRLWGVMTAGSTRLEPRLPDNTEARLVQFTELLATAIANAESRAEIAASRARVVAAADETRRRIERDLHDGAQQRLVSLGLELRAAQAEVPPALGGLEGELANVAEGLASVQHELREFARGIHPAILGEGGLGPALKTLARRSAIPVQLEMRSEARLAERVEVAAYYIVSEALTNAAKHAHASVVNIEVEADDRDVRVWIRDDGAGGADPARGSGLLGLKDRVEALGGTIAIRSPIGAGTSLDVKLPLSE